MKKPTRFLVNAIVLAAVVVFGANTAKAAQPPKGLSVSPALQQLTLPAGSTQKQVEFTLTNNESNALNLTVGSADFNTLDETGGLYFVGANPTELEKKYGLTTWISLPQKNITIPAHQSTVLRVILLNQPSLAPGGHYGAILFGLPEGQLGAGNGKVSLRPIASALMFVEKTGGELHRLGLQKVDFYHGKFSLPSSVSLDFRNNGNVHLIPRGSVTISDPRGKLVSKGIINENSLLILPEKTRRYSVQMRSVRHATLPGKYRLAVNFRFDGLDQVRTYQTSFFVAPFLPLLALLAVIGLLVWVLWPRLRWQTNKRLGRQKNKS